MNRKICTVLTLVSAVWLVGSGCSSTPQLSTTTYASTERSPIAVACPGRVEGKSDTVEVGAATDGLLKAVYVTEGQQVARGARLAEIACDDTRAELGAAQWQLESARQTRLRIMRGSREEERRSAEQRTTAAGAVLEQAAAQWQRMQQLHSEGVVANSAVDESRRDHDVAKARFEEARKNEDFVKAAALEEDVAKAEADVRTAEQRVLSIEQRLNKCVIVAPIAGEVLRLVMKPGEAYSTMAPRAILRMADTSGRRVRAEVDERDVSQVRIGQRVLVSLESDRARQLLGHVSSIAAVMGRKKTLTGDPAEKADHDVLEVLVDVDKAGNSLPLGLRVSAQFLR